jgi:hypothetical protein
MFGLPEDVSRHVREFMCPIRFDWRTCKAHEAALIRQETHLLCYQITEMYLEGELSRPMFEEIYEWTIYGMKHSFDLSLGGREPLGPPRQEHYREYPLGWYIHQIMWVC